MILDRTDTPRATLLARGEILPVIDQYLVQVASQAYAPIPVIVGPRGSGRTALLQEIGSRQGVIGRSVGFGAVKTGLGQALIDAVAGLADSVARRRPGSASLDRLIAAGEEFMEKAPDECTVAVFSQAVDFLLYALSNELLEIQGGFLILIDDIDRSNDSRLRVLIEGLVALAETGAPLPIVFARMQERSGGRVATGLEEIPLRRLTNADLADLTERAGMAADSEGIKVMAEFTQGLPGQVIAVLEACEGNHRLSAAVVTSAITKIEMTRAALRATESAKHTQDEESFRKAPSGPTGVATIAPALSQAELHAQTVAAQPQARLAPTASTAPNPRLAAMAPATPRLAETNALPTRSPRPNEPERGLTRTLLPTGPKAAQSVVPEPVIPEPVVPEPIVEVVLFPISLNPTQKRCLESMVELSADNDSVTLALLRRRLGDVSRFGGAATPVVVAVKELVAAGALLHSADDVLAFTPLGNVTVAAITS